LISLKFGARKKHNKHPESDICINLCLWFNYNYPEHKKRYLRLEVGGNRTKITQSILKAEGNKAGVADLFIAIPNKNGGGLWLEVKTKTGRLSDKQKIFHNEMKDDYTCVTAYGYNECKDAIYQYMISMNISPKYRDF